MLKIKIKKKPKQILCIIIIILFCCFFYLILKNKNYQITYYINSVEITEKFDSKNQVYQFIFKIGDRNYISNFKNKYLYQKKLIKSIEEKSINNTNCIIPQSKKITLYPLCYENDELISFHIINNKEIIPKNYFNKVHNENKEYNKIKINFLNNKKFFIWNYKGFYVLDKKKNKTINIFEEDIYNIPLSSKSQNYIIIADYNNQYNFNKFYLINSKNNKVKEFTTNKELSFDSYFLGYQKNKIYFMDKKNKKEYEINLKNSKIISIGKKGQGRFLNNSSWEEISLTKLSKKDYKFPNNSIFDYQIINNKLYLLNDDYKTLISNYNIKEIIEVENDTVYYLVDDKLYMFNNEFGEVLLLSYFEWNFNYKNMIYIF